MVRFRDLALTLWILTAYVITSVQTADKGQHWMISSSQPFVVALCDEVILPCHVKPVVNVEGQTVMWWRAGIPPDPGDPLSEYRFVHMYRDYHDMEDMKMESYAGRTTLDKDGLKHGNVSLKITNTRLSDQGRYRCLIPELWSASVIKLVVVPNSVQTPTTETTFHSRTLQTQDPENEMTVSGGRSHPALISVVVFCVTLILAGGVGGYLFKLKREKCENLLEYDVAPNKPPPV